MVDQTDELTYYMRVLYKTNAPHGSRLIRMWQYLWFWKQHYSGKRD